MIREAELFVTAEQVAVWVLGRVGREHRSTTVPPPFGLPDDTPVPISAVIRDHARDDATVPDLLAGGEPGTDDPLAGGDNDREVVLTRLAEESVAAASKATDPDAIVHSRHGDVTVADYLLRQTVLRAVTAHEVAVFSGSVCPLTEAFSRSLWELTEPRADHWREVGLFGPALTPVPSDVSWRDRFLMSAGRDPHPLWDR